MPYDTSWFTTAYIYNVIIQIVRMVTLITCILCPIGYLLKSTGLFRMAARRRLPQAWIAFVPFVNNHLLGDLCGKVKVGKTEIKNTGVWLLLLPTFCCLLLLIASVAYTATVGYVALTGSPNNLTFASGMILTVFGMACFVVLRVTRGTALYSLYCTVYTNGIAVALTVLSTFFFTRCVVIFITCFVKPKQVQHHFEITII